MNLQISDQTYQDLLQAAKLRGMTPEEFVEWLISQQPVGRVTNEDDFFRALGQTDEQIAKIKERARQNV